MIRRECFSPSDQWEPPTAGEVAEFFQLYGLNGNRAAKILQVDRSTVSRMLASDKPVRYPLWRTLVWELKHRDNIMAKLLPGQGNIIRVVLPDDTGSEFIVSVWQFPGEDSATLVVDFIGTLGADFLSSLPEGTSIGCPLSTGPCNLKVPFQSVLQDGLDASWMPPRFDIYINRVNSALKRAASTARFKQKGRVMLDFVTDVWPPHDSAVQ